MGNGVISYDTCDGKDYKTMRDIIQNFLKLFHTYKQSIYKTCALALVFLAGCFLSFTMGRRFGQLSLPPAPKPSAIGTPSTAETLNGTPHFEFPPSASYSDATPSNAVLMSPDILNLAYLYEDGADTSQPSYSYAGRLYDQLAGLDAKWSSGIYDLYHYTPVSYTHLSCPASTGSCVQASYTGLIWTQQACSLCARMIWHTTPLPPS